MRTTHPASIIQPGDDLPAEIAGESRSLSSLGNHAGIVSAPEEALKRANAVYRKFSLLNTARTMFPTWRIYRCLRQPHSSLIDIFHNPKFTSASFGGLETCGSVHICPVCGAKIMGRRAEEITTAITSWLDQGGGMMFATFTLQHSLDDTLEQIGVPLNEGYRRMRAGRRWLAFKEEFGVIGSITAREYTFGEHGWHPHLHALLFVKGGLKPRQIWDVGRWLKQRWGEEMVKFGRFASYQYGVKTERPKDPKWLAEYATKVGRAWTVGDEIARANIKKGRQGKTPVQLLEAVEVGDLEARQRFKEYAYWTFHKNALVWTPGLRARLGLAVEKTDDEIAAERTEGEQLLASLTVSQWMKILSKDIRAEVLLVAAAGSAFELTAFLAGYGIYLEQWQIAGKSEVSSD